MRNTCILLTDSESISERLIIKSYKKLTNSKIHKFFFIGDKDQFKKIFKLCKKNNKFKFINIQTKKRDHFKYINNITNEGLNLIKNKLTKFIINMPLNKKKYFGSRFNGFTEFYAKKIGISGKETMLLYNDNFSVSPVTTHLKVKDINKNLNKKKILTTILNINSFYKFFLKKKVSIIVLGLNPHSGIDMKSPIEESKIIEPVIKKCKKMKINISGPVSPDTAFLNYKNKVFVGMYHDQVLIPFKTINKFNGINLTIIGGDIVRISPDHGTGNYNNKRIKINCESFIKCINFCEKY